LGNILGIFFTARLVTLDSQAVVTKTEWASQTLLQFNDEIWTRIARWFLFKPKIPIWVNFGGPYMENVYIYVHLEYFTDIWDIL
jgi:hypothetical protein